MSITIKDVSISRKEWIDRMQLSERFAKSAIDADVLLVPSNYVDRPLAFPVLTSDIFTILKSKLECSVEICVNDEDFEEIELNSHTFRLPTIKVKAAMLTIALNLVSTYIYNKLDNASQPDVNVNVNVEVTVPEYQKPTEMDFTIEVEDTTGKSKAFHYKGSAADFNEASEAIKQMWDEEKSK